MSYMKTIITQHQFLCELCADNHNCSKCIQHIKIDNKTVKVKGGTGEILEVSMEAPKLSKYETHKLIKAEIPNAKTVYENENKGQITIEEYMDKEEQNGC